MCAATVTSFSDSAWATRSRNSRSRSVERMTEDRPNCGVRKSTGRQAVAAITHDIYSGFPADPNSEEEPRQKRQQAGPAADDHHARDLQHAQREQLRMDRHPQDRLAPR